MKLISEDITETFIATSIATSIAASTAVSCRATQASRTVCNFFGIVGTAKHIEWLLYYDSYIKFYEVRYES